MKNKFLVRLTFFGIMAVIFLLIIIVSFEIYFRMSGKYDLASFQLDNKELWRMKANINEIDDSPEGAKYTLTIDKDGFRGPLPKEEKAPNTKRILVLGDSYIAAVAYPINQVCIGQFQTLLDNDASLHQKFEVINTGVPAWSVDQEWQYLINDGLKMNPDYVLIMASPNDIRELYCKKFVTLENDSLIVHAPDFILKKRLGWYLSERSALFQYMQDKWFNSNYGTLFDLFEIYTMNFGKDDAHDWDRPQYLKHPIPEIIDAEHLYEKVLGKITSECGSRNIPVSICLNTVPYDHDSTYVKDTLCNVFAAQDFFENLTTRKNIPFLNLDKATADLKNLSDFFIKDDVHYNLKGQTFTGQQLYSFFKKEVLKQ